MAVAFDRQGKQMAAATIGGAVEIIDPQTSKPRRVLRRGTPLQGTFLAMRKLAFSPDGKTLAEVGGDTLRDRDNNEVRLWDLATGKVRSLRGHPALVSGVAFSPDGKRLATASLDMNRGIDGEVKVWDVATGSDLLTLEGQLAVAFSPDGLKLASVGVSLEKAAAPVVRIREALPWKKK